MDLKNKKSTKVIRITFFIITTIILLEFIIAGILFVIEKKNQKNNNKIENITNNKQIKLISEIEEKVILEKILLEKKRLEKKIEKIDTNPRTRPSPRISF